MSGFIYNAAYIHIRNYTQNHTDPCTFMLWSCRNRFDVPRYKKPNSTKFRASLLWALGTKHWLSEGANGFALCSATAVVVGPFRLTHTHMRLLNLQPSNPTQPTNLRSCVFSSPIRSVSGLLQLHPPVQSNSIRPQSQPSIKRIPALMPEMLEAGIHSPNLPKR